MPENDKHQFMGILEPVSSCFVSFIDGNSKYWIENSLQIIKMTMKLVEKEGWVIRQSAGLAIVAFVEFTCLAILVNKVFLVIYFISLIGALSAFIRFNLSKKKKIFMGDAGSLVLGFLLVVSEIILIQTAYGTENIKTMLAIIIGVLTIPVADSLRVYRRRFNSGISPFQADKTHFHHLVLLLGVNHKKAILSIVLFSIGIVGLSMLFGTYYNLTLSIILILFLFVFITNVLGIYRKLNIWKLKIKRIEGI